MTDPKDVPIEELEAALAKAKIPMPKPCLYIVWSPTGEAPAKATHKTHQAAHAAAHLMAKKFPGQTFMVMAKSGRAIVADPAALQQKATT